MKKYTKFFFVLATIININLLVLPAGFFGLFSKKKVVPSSPAQSIQSTQQSLTITSSSDKNVYSWLKTYAEVIGLVKQKALRDVDFSSFIQDSIKSAVGKVDAHSSFFDVAHYKDVMESTSGEFSGIGVGIVGKMPEDDALPIISIISGGPAEKAGLCSGDKIVEIDGNILKGLSTDESIQKLKGKTGTVVILKLIRNKKPLEIKITRELVKDQTSLCYYFEAYQVYYLALKLFTETISQQIEKILTIANKGICKGIVLDLRHNPGGTLQSAIQVAGHFLPKGSLVAVTKNNTNDVLEQYYTKTDPLLHAGVPIIILIDNFTASAAEILAGALRYYAEHGTELPPDQHTGKQQQKQSLLVFLLGTQTFGKGSVQEVIPISNGCALKLTTMLYYLPGDTCVQATGIDPDFIVQPRIMPTDEIKWVNDLYGKETTLRNHIKIDQKGHVVPVNVKQKNIQHKKTDDDINVPSIDNEKLEKRREEELCSDSVLQKAITMINSIGLAQKHFPTSVDTRKKALIFLKNNVVTDEKQKINKVI